MTDPVIDGAAGVSSVPMADATDRSKQKLIIVGLAMYLVGLGIGVYLGRKMPAALPSSPPVVRPAPVVPEPSPTTTVEDTADDASE